MASRSLLILRFCPERVETKRGIRPSRALYGRARRPNISRKRLNAQRRTSRTREGRLAFLRRRRGQRRGGNPRYFTRQLRARRERPRHRATAKQQNELPSSYIGHGGCSPALCQRQALALRGRLAARVAYHGVDVRSLGKPELFWIERWRPAEWITLGVTNAAYFVSASEHYGVSWCGGAMVGVESGSGTSGAKIL
jgi:hypothetical protein